MNPHELLSATGIGVRTAPFPLLSGDSEMSAAKGSLPELSAHSNHWERSKLSDAPRLRIGAYAVRQGFSRGSGMYETFSGGSHVWASLESRYFLLEACAQGLYPRQLSRRSWRRCGFGDSRDSPRLWNCGVAGFASCGFNQFWGGQC